MALSGNVNPNDKVVQQLFYENVIYITNNLPIFVLRLIIRNLYEPYNTHQAVFFIVK